MMKPFYQYSPREILDFLRRIDPKSRRKLLWGAGGGVVFFFFIFWPAWFTRTSILSKIKGVRGQIQLAEVQIAQEPKLLEERKEHEAFVQTTQLRLLKEREGEGIVGILAGIAGKSKVTLLKAEPQEKGEGSLTDFPLPFGTKYRKVSYWVTVEGGYHQLSTFVSEVENHAKVLRVEELSITPREETPAAHLGEIRVSAFSLREGAKPGA